MLKLLYTRWPLSYSSRVQWYGNDKSFHIVWVVSWIFYHALLKQCQRRRSTQRHQFSNVSRHKPACFFPNLVEESEAFVAYFHNFQLEFCCAVRTENFLRLHSTLPRKPVFRRMILPSVREWTLSISCEKQKQRVKCLNTLYFAVADLRTGGERFGGFGQSPWTKK